MNTRLVEIVVTLTLFVPNAFAAPEAVAWNGHHLNEVRNLESLPKTVQDALSVEATGLMGIADRGGRFNVTDVVNPKLPMRRFLLAGVDGDSALVAIEHGGRGYRIEATLYIETKGKLVARRQWPLSDAPKHLGALIRSIEAAPQKVSTREEAESIAKAYFSLHVGCGAYTGISESSAAWIVEGRFGFGGIPITGFFIDKETGRITSPIGPSYANQDEMRLKAPK